MDRSQGSRWQSRKGAAALEFALVLPVYVGLISGVADYGLFFMERSKALDAARDAARLGVAAPRLTDPRSVATSAALAILIAEDSACTSGCQVESVLSTAGVWQVLDVRITRSFDPLVGLVPVPTGMVAQQIMALEQQNLSYYGL